MTEQDEMLHSIHIEQAVRDLGIDRVREILEGLEDAELDNYFRINRANGDGTTTKGLKGEHHGESSTGRERRSLSNNAHNT